MDDPICESWLEDKASILEDQCKVDNTKSLNNRIHREQQRLTKRRLKRVFQGASISGVTTVNINEGNRGPTECTTKA